MGDSPYTEFTQEKKDKFLEALSSWPNITRAAEIAGISRRTIYLHRESDPEFEAAFQKAREKGVDVVEDKAFDRTDESDLMRIFMLKGNKPEKYKDRVEQEVKGNISVDFTGWTGPKNEE